MKYKLLEFVFATVIKQRLDETSEMEFNIDYADFLIAQLAEFDEYDHKSLVGSYTDSMKHAVINVKLMILRRMISKELAESLLNNLATKIIEAAERFKAYSDLNKRLLKAHLDGNKACKD